MDLSNKSILIVKPSSLGDVVHTLPLAHALKRAYPSCRITWIVQKPFSAILESDPAIDLVVPIHIPSTSDPQAGRAAFLQATVATIRVLRELKLRFRRAPHDLVLDLHASFRSGLLALTNPGGMRIGFADAKELNTLFQHRRIVPEPGKEHAVDKNLAFAKYLGCPVGEEDFRICVGPAAKERVRRFLGEAGTSSSGRIVYANPAARWATKFWSVPAWAELGDLLMEQARATVIFSGSPADVRYIGSIAARMKRDPLMAAGKLTLAEAVALIEASDIYVGVDSGPMHIAAFAGTPVVALFGPTDPAKVGPYGRGHRVVRRTELDCLACRKRQCADRKCLEGLLPETVFREIMDLQGW